MASGVIFDCDPGQDDAAALLLALASPELEVLGICTVGGNVPLQLTTTNALKVVELAGRPDVGVHAGCQNPIMRPLVTAEYVMGNDGMAGANLPSPTTPVQERHAVNYLVDTLSAAKEPLTVATLGPLTNLALALVQAPAIRSKIGRLVVMGGSMTRGNIVPQAEYNFYVDPHAAHIVLSAGLRPVIIGLDVTHQVLNTVSRIERIAARGTRAATAVAAMFMPHALVQQSLPPDSKPRGLMHDSCVTAFLVAPELFAGRDVHVAVETTSELTMGKSVVDWWGVTKREPNARVLDRIDVESFFELITERMGRLP